MDVGCLGNSGPLSFVSLLCNRTMDGKKASGWLTVQGCRPSQRGSLSSRSMGGLVALHLRSESREQRWLVREMRTLGVLLTGSVLSPSSARIVGTRAQLLCRRLNPKCLCCGILVHTDNPRLLIRLNIESRGGVPDWQTRISR